MAESPDGRGVILFGGQEYGDKRKTILELRAGADSWNILNVTLKNARKNHVVIPLSWFIFYSRISSRTVFI